MSQLATPLRVQVVCLIIGENSRDSPFCKLKSQICCRSALGDRARIPAGHVQFVLFKYLIHPMRQSLFKLIDKGRYAVQ